MESCSMSCIKYLLFVFNSIFAISGLGIIVAGAIVLADIGDFQQFIEGRIIAPAIVLIVVGTIVFVIAFFGCFGAIRESFILLMAFAVLLFVVCIIELAVGIAAAIFKNDFEIVLKKSLQSSMDNYARSESEKVAWNKVQDKLECCGVDNFDDWTKHQVNIPASCCYANQKWNEDANQNCRNANRGADYLYQDGCYEKLKMKVRDKAAILVGVGIGIAFIEMIGIILACWLATTIKKEGNK